MGLGNFSAGQSWHLAEPSGRVLLPPRQFAASQGWQEQRTCRGHGRIDAIETLSGSRPPDHQAGENIYCVKPRRGIDKKSAMTGQ